MSRLLCSIRTSESNLLRRELILSCAIINLFGFLCLVFLVFQKDLKSARNPRLTTRSDLIKLTPHFQKLPHLQFL